MLTLAGILALISMYPSHENLILSGTLSQGEEVDISEMIPSGSFVGGELTLKSESSRIAVIMPDGMYKEFTVKEERLTLKNPEVRLKSIEGNVNYTIKANMVFYPFSRLSYLALVIMISGSIIINLGLIKAFSELM